MLLPVVCEKYCVECLKEGFQFKNTNLWVLEKALEFHIIDPPAQKHCFGRREHRWQFVLDPTTNRVTPGNRNYLDTWRKALALTLLL